MNRPADALEDFETSEKQDTNRFRGLYGAGKAAAAESGDSAKAKRYFTRLVDLAGKGDSRPASRQREGVSRNLID